MRDFPACNCWYNRTISSRVASLGTLQSDMTKVRAPAIANARRKPKMPSPTWTLPRLPWAPGGRRHQGMLAHSPGATLSGARILQLRPAQTRRTCLVGGEDKDADRVDFGILQKSSMRGQTQ